MGTGLHQLLNERAAHIAGRPGYHDRHLESLLSATDKDEATSWNVTPRSGNFLPCRFVVYDMSDPIAGLLQAHRPYLINLAYQMVGDIGDAEDIVQEAFLSNTYS